jgi:hypothetical protein
MLAINDLFLTIVKALGCYYRHVLDEGESYNTSLTRLGIEYS